MSHQFLLINAGIAVPIIIVAKDYQATDFIFVVEAKTILSCHHSNSPQNQFCRFSQQVQWTHVFFENIFAP